MTFRPCAFCRLHAIVLLLLGSHPAPMQLQQCRQNITNQHWNPCITANLCRASQTKHLQKTRVYHLALVMEEIRARSISLVARISSARDRKSSRSCIEGSIHQDTSNAATVHYHKTKNNISCCSWLECCGEAGLVQKEGTCNLQKLQQHSTWMKSSSALLPWQFATSRPCIGLQQHAADLPLLWTPQAPVSRLQLEHWATLMLYVLCNWEMYIEITWNNEVELT